jgi:nucleoside-diphosphate-sugar epimerase
MAKEPTNYTNTSQTVVVDADTFEFETLEQHNGVATVIRFHVENEDVRAGDVRDSQADISKARRILGYEPIVRFEDGLEKTVSWYRSSQVPVA